MTTVPTTTSIHEHLHEFNTGKSLFRITSFIGSIFWYAFVFLLIGGVCIWAMYSIINSQQRVQLTDYLVNSIKQIRGYFTTPSTSHASSLESSSISLSSSINTIPHDTSSVHTPSTLYNPNDIETTSSRIEKSTQAINNALNYNAPIIDHPDGAFKNDDPDSTIQSGRNSRMSLLGWSITDESGSSEPVPLPNAYISSSSSV